ncbi:5-formyltetrahydrofolate cyclo-ligase [Daejeonella oryzae]|uniref:5-formyltetrahydrofolate cyclo-ligase n=1 Tax=Daejeonella oryzae TaxID=1122943 RepID=UPI00040CACA5|nr:5-formyltetrahydrofolate cyclo-ligase [Daejeonella oryzae]
MYKETLRKTYLERRKNLSRSQYWTLNENLLEQVAKINWDQFKLVHLFMPINKHLEVDTFSILEYFKEKEPQLKIVIPRTNFDLIEIENVLFDPIYTILGRNKYDIPEPIHGKIISSSQIDAVFVPLLAFDLKGNRVGYGKGFYDKFLKTCRNDVQKIGLSFFDPVDQINDLNEFDIPLNACITPSKIWEF